MIYTLTLNPALDYIMHIPYYKSGIVNRADSVTLSAGGKGINVSLMLKNLGIPSILLGFTAGFTGVELQRILTNQGCKTDFIMLNDGATRINVKLKAEQETELNAPGPTILKADMDSLYKHISILNDDDILVLAGNVPGGIPKSIYSDILKSLTDKKVKAIVDTEGDALLDTLAYKPFLIKPNHHELGAIFNTQIDSPDTAAKYAKLLCEKGAQNVLVSMGKQGAVLITSDDGIFYSPAPKGVVINSTGAGDSMVAGFIAGFLKNKDLKTALSYGVCAGSATAFSEGIANELEVRKLLSMI